MALGAGGPTIVAKFIADTSQMTGEVDKATSSASDSMTGFAKKAAVALGGAFVVDQVVQFGKASVEAAAADAEAQAQLAAALRNTTGATDDQIASAESFIGALSKQTAIADDDLRPALATLARGFNDTEQAQKALALATDVSAGTGKDLSTVTEAMMKAANGSTTALGKLGIETKNADGSAKSLDQMMADMSKTFEGQASTAANSTAGQIRGAEVAMGEMQETIGAALLPVLGTLASILVEQVFPAIASVVDFISDHLTLFEALGIGLAAVGVAILVSLVPAFIAWAGTAAAAAVATLAATWPLLLIGAAVAALAYLIISNWDTIKAATLAVWDAIMGAIRFVWDWISTNWPTLLAILTGPFGIAVLLIVRNWDTIKAAVSVAWDFIRGLMGTIADIVSAPFRAAASLVASAWELIKTGAQGAYDFVVGVFAGLGNAITAPVKLAWNALASIWNSSAGAISISIPDWVPGVGGNSFDVPDLPRLAAGGVLTRETLFIGGEAGTEIVTPEALMRQIVADEAGGGSYVLNLYPRTADAADIALGFRRLELLAGVT